MTDYSHWALRARLKMRQLLLLVALSEEMYGICTKKKDASMAQLEKLTTELELRLKEHDTGGGARLTQVWVEHGCAFHCVRIWQGGRQLERRLLATADVLIAPGPVETFGLAAVEALACGTPVVVDERSTLPAVVGGAGVAAPATPPGFADGVEELLGRPLVARTRAARARAAEFGWDRTVAGFLDAHGLTRPAAAHAPG